MNAIPIVKPIQDDNSAGVNISESAATTVRALLSGEDRCDLRFRIDAQPGGCSGLRYSLTFDDQKDPEDRVTSYDGFEVVVSGASFPYLVGATIDFIERDGVEGFAIDNPNAENSCACSGGSCR